MAPNDYGTWKKSLEVLFSAVCGCLNELLVEVANKYKSANKLAIASTKYNFKYINVVR